MQSGRSSEVGDRPRGVGEVRVGFVPLIDAAPVIAAQELGFFGEEGLSVVLERQLGWGNIRDKIAGGLLHAAHALLGLSVGSNLSAARPGEQLVSLMSLGTGGDGITVGKSLLARGVSSPASLARLLSAGRGSRPVFGHVFGVSAHHYLLRRWLAGGGVDPDRDVDLCVLPPPQIAGQMKRGHLAGYCVGEPWNTVAEVEGYGALASASVDVVADHPDKTVTVRRDWLSLNAETAVRLCRAVIRGCAFCEAPGNRPRLAAMLSDGRYLDLPTGLIEMSLRPARGVSRSPFRSLAPRSTFPNLGFATWLLGEMRRWNHVPAHVDVLGVARGAIDASHYRTAAADLGVPCPPEDATPVERPSNRSTATVAATGD